MSYGMNVMQVCYMLRFDGDGFCVATRKALCFSLCWDITDVESL